MAHGITPDHIHIRPPISRIERYKVINDLGSCFAFIVKAPAGLGDAFRHFKAPAAGNIIGADNRALPFQSPIAGK